MTKTNSYKMNIPSIDKLNPDKPCAIVADVRIHGLLDLLKHIVPRLPAKVSLWLSEKQNEITDWAKACSIEVVVLNNQETISLITPGIKQPIKLARRVLDPVQLIFVGRNEISQDGYFIGAVYSFLNLIPAKFRPEYDLCLSDVLLELYLKFQYSPAILPIRNAGLTYIEGDAWSLDEAMLAGLNPKFGRLHSKLCRYLPPPAPFICPKEFKPDVADDKALSLTASQLVIERVFKKPANALWQAFLILNEIIAFRIKRKWASISRL